MRAIMLTGFGDSLLARTDAPMPQPGPDEALVRVVAAGVCGTDVKIWRGDLSRTPLPLIMGHETAGVVAAAAAGVDGPGRGTRVVVFHHLHCGSCGRCTAGSENLCERLRGRVGFDHDGGWAEYVAVPARNLLPIPDGVTAREACVVPDAVATVWRALLTIGRVRSDEDVAIVGAGGLGLTAIQLAREYGRHVLAIDVTEEKLELAEKAGAHGVALPGRAARAAAELPDGGPHVVLDCAGTPGAVTLAASLLSLRAGARLIQVGYSTKSRIDLPASDVVLRELQILGCRAAAVSDLAAALAAVGRGSVRPFLGEERPLEEAQAAIDSLISGSAAGRQTLDVSDELE